LQAFIHLNRFEGRSSFSSWVTRIAINTSLMILRKKRVNKELSIEASENDCESYNRWELRDLSEDPKRRYARHEKRSCSGGQFVGCVRISELQSSFNRRRSIHCRS
jgi:RNA polymerase sigma-70 factor (ECF subfamily)